MAKTDKLSDVPVYLIVSLGLHATIIVPLFIAWIYSLRVVKHGGDRARLGFVWMKATFPLILV